MPQYSSVLKFRVSCGYGVGCVQSVRVSDLISQEVWDRSTIAEQREYIQQWLKSWALNLIKTKFDIDEAENPIFELMMYKTL